MDCEVSFLTDWQYDCDKDCLPHCLVQIEFQLSSSSISVRWEDELLAERVLENQQIVLGERTVTRLNVFFQHVMLDMDQEVLKTTVKERLETLFLIPLVNKAQRCLVVGSQSARALEVCNPPGTKLLPPLALAVLSLLAVVSSNGLARLAWSQLAGSTHLVELQCRSSPDWQTHGKVKLKNEEEMKDHAKAMLELELAFAWNACTWHGRVCVPATLHICDH